MQIRVRLASISLFAYLGALAGCGDDIPRQQNGGGGGSGGSVGGSGGGSGGSAGGSTGGSIAGSGGSVAGRGGSGGGGTGGTGGSGGTGGRGGTGGSAGTGGMAGTGGGGTGGGGTGGGGTGGSTAGTGGGGTGGSTAGTGGGGTGGGGTGGGGTGGQQCYTVTFVAPTNNATLTVADDTNMSCADGFQYNVRITTNAPAGTMVQLFNNGTTLIGTATVASGAATFAVQLASSGQSALSIQFPSTAACTDPSTRSTVTVSCPNTPPTCNIAQPTISATHPALNGVPFPAGDRAGQPGSPYSVTFQVTTSAEDGQPVTLAYNNAATPSSVTTLTATASGGSATFGVPLSPDATYQVIATCKNAANVTGSSQLTSYPVDTQAPNLTVTQPADGQFFGPTDLDAQGRFSVCGRTTSTDAAGLPASLGPAVNNLCVALGGSSTCAGTAAVAAINTDACVPVTCPGGAPFNITVTLKDAAGNPTSMTIQGVSCASTLPSVQVIRPVSDAPAFIDPSKHILSATAPVGVRDLDPTTPGAQADVVACTDRVGGAALLVGLSGGTLTPLGSAVTTVAALPADNCPTGLGFIARFAGVTLPDSIENTDGSLATPTELRVRVTDAVNPSSIGTSVAVALWVDPIAPPLTLATPANLCGSFQQSATTVTQDVTFNAESDRILLQVTNGSITDTLMPSAFAGGIATFSAVAFDPGQNNVTATATDPAGNATALAPVPCTVTVGSAPVVTFTTPTAGQVLCPAGSTTPGCLQDADGSTSGWQGTLTAHVSGDGQPITSGTVTFTVGTTTLGTGTLDASGDVSLSGITLPEGSVTIVATTDNIPNRGVGTGSVTVTVDLGPPAAPTGLAVSIIDRRRTTMRVTWTAPGDGGLSVTGYDVRYAKVPITSANFDDASVTTAVTYTGSPAAPGQPDGIDVTSLYIETDYHFAVRAKDGANNLSAIVATGSATRAAFLVNVLSGLAAGDHIGQDIDGSGDFGRPAGSSFTADGMSDLLVGTNLGGRAYLFMGASGGYPPTPTVTFTGVATGFGSAIVNAGDIDGDTLDDIAITATNDGTGKVYIYSRKTPPVSWGTTGAWPSTLTDAQANYVIAADATLTGLSFRSLARLGNFDGSGSDDLLIAFRLRAAAPGNGAVFVVRGSSSFGSVTLPNAAAALEVDGALPGFSFGVANIGLGPFLNHGFVSSASTAGTVYAFAGQATAGPITAAMNDDSTVGTAADRYGITLGLIGALGASPGAISIGATMGQYVDVHMGTVASGPFTGTSGGAPTPTVRFGASTLGNSFGVVNIGGGVKGTSLAVSVVGDASPDLILAAQAAVNLPIYVVDGSVIPSLSGSVDLSVPAANLGGKMVSILGRMPAAWTGYTTGTIIPDSDGDGYGDFAVGEAVTSTAGRVVVFH
jgi:hypothetical protein